MKFLSAEYVDDNPEAARALAQSLLDRIAQLETFPGLGRPGERTGTRELISSPYVIVYRVKDDVCEILHNGTAHRIGALNAMFHSYKEPPSETDGEEGQFGR